MSKNRFPFEADESTDVPLWVQLRQRLIFLIETGYFEPGEKLPTVRGLAAEISINYNTVNKAYLSLVSDGYLRSKRGSGVYVRDLDGEVDNEFIQEVETMIDDFIEACRDLGLALDDIEARVRRRISEKKAQENADCADDEFVNSKVIEMEEYSRMKKRMR